MRLRTSLFFCLLFTLTISCERDPELVPKKRISFDLPCRLASTVYESTIYRVRTRTKTYSKTEYKYEYVDRLREVYVSKLSNGVQEYDCRLKWSYDSSLCQIEKGNTSVKLEFSSERQLIRLEYSNGDSYNLTYVSGQPFEISVDSTNRVVYRLFWLDGNVVTVEDYSNPDKPEIYRDLEYSQGLNWTKAELWRFHSGGLSWKDLLLFSRNDLKTQYLGGVPGGTNETWNDESLLTSRVKWVSAGDSYTYSTSLEWYCD